MSDIDRARTRRLVRSVMGRATPEQLAEAEDVANIIRAAQECCPICSKQLRAHDTLELTICSVLATGPKGV